ncbi:MAG: Ig-like domain-containing protein [Deltaproteobacteria bacterium]|nr:Ig-like domain-containing protein [Deltaproteobacteria bacterium]
MGPKEKKKAIAGILFLFAIFLTGLTGCGEPELGTIKIESQKEDLKVGDTVTLRAVSMSKDVAEMPNVSIQWRVQGDAGSIDNSGTFTAVRPGEVKIIAAAKGISDEITLNIEALPIAALKLDPKTAEMLPEAGIEISIAGTASDGKPAGFHEIQLESPTKGAKVSGESVNLDESGKASFKLIAPPLPGKALVRASAGDVKAETEITINPRPVNEIEVMPETRQGLTETTVSVRLKGLSENQKPAAMNRINVSSPTEGIALSTEEVVLDENGESGLTVTLSLKPGENKIVFNSGDKTRELVIEGTPIKRIEILPKKEEFEVAEQINFKAAGYDDFGNTRPVAVEWSLSGDVAELSQEGTVKMKKPGRAILFAGFKDIEQGRPFSIVPGHVAKIEIAPEAADMKVGDNLTFTFKTFNAQGAPLTEDVKWEVEGDIGSIAQDGTFLAKAVGKGSIIAKSGDVHSSVPVQVAHGPLADIIIELDKQQLTAGEKVVLKAQGVDAYGNRFPISPEWLLSASLGKMDQEADEFMPLNAGAGEILAKVGDIVQGVKIEVVPAELARLEIQPPALDVVAGKRVKLETTGYDRFGNTLEVQPVFSISDPLGEIDDTGTFTAKKSGSTLITVSAGDQVKEISVAVVPSEMTTVTLAPESPVEVSAGKAQTFSAVGYDAQGNPVQAKVDWKMRPDLGNLDAKGVFFPEKAGKTVLTAKVHQVRTGKKMKIDTEVRVAPGDTARIKVEPESLKIVAGEKTVFSATAYDSFQNKTEATPLWRVEPAALGRITQEGRFSAIAAESGKIVARHGNVAGVANVTVVPAEVVFLKIVPEEITAQAGETVKVGAVMEDRFGNRVKGGVIWALSDESLGQMTDDDRLVAKKTGEGRLIAAAYNIAASIPVTVKESALDALLIKPAGQTVKSGSSVQFKASGFDAGGNPVTVDLKWSVEGAVGSIDSDGTFSAKKAGSSQVTVSHGGVSAAASVTVTPGDPSEISLEPKSFTITAGKKKQLTYMIKDADGNTISSPDLTWEVSDDLGSIDDENHFSAHAAGTGVIRLASGDQSVESAVTVESGPIHEVVIEPATASFKAGEEQGFTVKGYDSEGNLLDLTPAWSTSGGIGTVDENGNFKAITTGSGFVTVRMKNATAVARVTVSPGTVASVAVSPECLKLNAGAKENFKAMAYDAHGNETPAEISWSLQSKKPIGEISNEGLFKARHAGKGIVIAAVSSVKGEAQVRVVPGQLKKIVLISEKLALRSGETVRVKVAGEDAFGNRFEIDPTFAAAPEGICGMDADHRLTALKAGKGTLRVSAGHVTADFPIAVSTGPLKSLEIQLPEGRPRAGYAYSFKVIGRDAGGNKVPAKAQWSVSQDVGQIDKNTGMFHAMTVGTGLVVASADGIVAHTSITVGPGTLYSLFLEPNPVTVGSDTLKQFNISGVDVAKNQVAVSESAVRWNVTGGIGFFEKPGLFHGTQMGKGKVVAGSGDLLAEAIVTVVPGKPEPENCRIRVTHPTLPADGEAFSEIIVDVRDQYNNPVPDVKVRLVSSRQTDRLVQPGETDRKGAARGRISSRQTGVSVIRAVVGETPFMDTARVNFE